MSDSLYLSRARLCHDAPISALRDVLSRLDSARVAAGHRLIWTLFGDEPDRRRDFLWREAEPGVFYLLSSRPPEDRNGLFRLDPPKPFAPALATGDRLHFVLRANATVARKVGTSAAEGARGQRCDVVMDALHGVPSGERAHERARVLPAVAGRWLALQGETHGFEIARRNAAEAWELIGAREERPEALDVMGYRVLRIGRGGHRKPMQVGVLDLQGTLVVRDPTRFVAALGQGFGRAKAFGCGLMLLRRAG